MSLPRSLVHVTQTSDGTPAPTFPVRGVEVRHGCLAAPSLWYYDNQHFKNAPPTIYEHLVSQAKRLVQVWDPYFYPEDAPLFTAIPPSVLFKFMTAWGFAAKHGPGKPVIDFQSALKTSVRAGVNVQFRIYNAWIDGNPFHDRYLLVDDSVFMVGASVEYHHRPKKNVSHAVARIDDPVGAALVRNRFDEWWNHKDTVTIP